MKHPCLLVHGITASPTQVEPQRAALERTGATVMAPLLSGHATDIREMDALQWEDWYGDVLRSATELCQRSGQSQINYFGLSWGALLGLKLALDRPELVRKIVCVGTPIFLHDWVNYLLPIIRYTPLRWVVKRWPKDYRHCVADPEGCAEYRATSYDQFPIVAVEQIARLQQEVNPRLGELKTPLLVMHAEKDKSAPPRGAQHLYDRAAGPKSLQWLRSSYHVATMDYDRDRINKRVVEFFGGGS